MGNSVLPGMLCRVGAGPAVMAYLTPYHDESNVERVGALSRDTHVLVLACVRQSALVVFGPGCCLGWVHAPLLEEVA